MPAMRAGHGKEKTFMANARHYFGRHVIAVTGIDIVTSLGVSCKDSRVTQTSGRSGIHPIKRFPTNHLRTSIASTVDFPPASGEDLDLLMPELAEQDAKEATAQSALSMANYAGSPLPVRASRRP
jgi:3-oxoacyl-[acyl-carrier-protein] synthase II